MNMIEEPEAVQRALGKIQKSYERVMSEVYGIVRDVNEGGSVVEWLGTWAPGFHAQMQSDMCVMISNPMFKEFVLPELKQQCRFLEYPLYHFDGIEQIRHLDSLLSIKKLRAIQWSMVASQPRAVEFLPVLQKIQKAGKNLVMKVPPQDVQKLLDNLSCRGLHLIIVGVKTVEEANDLMKLVEKHSKDRG